MEMWSETRHYFCNAADIPLLLLWRHCRVGCGELIPGGQHASPYLEKRWIRISNQYFPGLGIATCGNRRRLSSPTGGEGREDQGNIPSDRISLLLRAWWKYGTLGCADRRNPICNPVFISACPNSLDGNGGRQYSILGIWVCGTSPGDPKVLHLGPFGCPHRTRGFPS